MPAILAKMLVSVVIILAAPALFTIVLIVLGPVMNGDEDVVIPLSVVAGLVPAAIAWWLVWLGEVRWNGARVAVTLGVAAVALLIAVVLGAIAAVNTRGDGVLIGFLLGGVAAWLVWFGATPLVWRESRAERAARLRGRGVDGVNCPTCGYSMAGLREAKCPECGAAYTVDQLVAEVLEQRAGLPADGG